MSTKHVYSDADPIQKMVSSSNERNETQFRSRTKGQKNIFRSQQKGENFHCYHVKVFPALVPD